MLGGIHFALDISAADIMSHIVTGPLILFEINSH